jgi:uncharacterized protein
MVPTFPKFRKITLQDMEEVEEFVEKCGYHGCDYNFVGMWSWENMGPGMEWAKIGENVVFKWWDYEKDEYYCSVLGKTDVARSVMQVLEYVQGKKGIADKLQLEPGQIADELAETSEVICLPDRDRSDYVFDVEEIASLAGGKWGRIRALVNQFNRNYPGAVVKRLEYSDKSVVKGMFELFEGWGDRQKNKKDVKLEREAMIRNLEFAALGKLVGVGVYINDKLAAFSTSSVAFGEYAQAHFRKADTSYVGVYQFLEQRTAIILRGMGRKLLNFEFDIGVPGLRKAKLAWNPVKMLDKYFVRYVNDGRR